MTKSQTPSAMRLLVWYDKNRRILPWRALQGNKPDPYRIWVSEVMLQQTTVAAVVPYFHKFMAKWPNVHALAKAPRDEVMQMWAGLGYYRRARFLHECAEVITRDFNGMFPQTEAELKKLPGFGMYTAASVLAIAFDKRANVVDGNVERVMARVFAVQTPLPKAKPELRALAERLLPPSRYGDYAQALMDLGATICTPRSPKCSLCPWALVCRAKAQGIAEQLPARILKKTKPVRRAIAFFVGYKDSHVLLRQRPRTGLLADMMEVPSSAWIEHEMPTLAKVKAQAPVKAKWTLLPDRVRHSFSHFDLELSVAVAAISSREGARGAQWVPVTRLADQALPSVMRKIIAYAFKQRGKIKL